MVTLATKIDVVTTDSVLEALLLEANLIKYHQPKYNTDEKDNKSHNYVVFTKEDFPKIMLRRGRTIMADGDTKKYKYVFGPFPHGNQLNVALKIIRKIFPFSDEKCTPASEALAAGKKPRACFNRQIGLCPGVCTGEISKETYAEHMYNLKLFFEGKKKALLRNLNSQMEQCAAEQKFEQAGSIKRQIFALNHIQDIALLKTEERIGTSTGGDFSKNAQNTAYRIEAYDVAHSSGKNVVGVMVVIEDGEPKKSDYRKFIIKLNPGINDTAALKEIVRRRLGHLEWPLPNLIVVDGAEAQLNAARLILNERGFNIDLVAVVKDAHHKPREILGEKSHVVQRGAAILLANSEAHRYAVAFHRSKRDKIV